MFVKREGKTILALNFEEANNIEFEMKGLGSLIAINSFVAQRAMWSFSMSHCYLNVASGVGGNGVVESKDVLLKIFNKVSIALLLKNI